MVSLFIVLMALTGARAGECESINNYRKVLSCIAERAPEIRRSHLELKVAAAEIDRADQWRNPELENRSLWSSSGETSGMATETQLLFPTGLGGKRSAQVRVAKAERASVEAHAQSTRERTLVESARALHRLRQLETEIELAGEAIDRFNRIVQAFRKRSQLNPEQAVSLTVFRYAFEEEKQKKSQLLAERSAILTDLSLRLGASLTAKKELYPLIPEKWPLLTPTSTENSAEARLALARAEQARAVSGLTKAESWPELKIGPSYERMPERDRTEERVGVGLTMELPLFNTNGAGRASAELSREVAAHDRDSARRRQQAELESLIEQYRLITSALTSAPNQNELEKGHRAFEAQFNRGLVSYSLMIEAHRQLHETVETKHRQELTALQLLWRYYQMTGQLTPEVL